MKTSFVAVVAATLFLVAALLGVGSSNGQVSSQSGTIVLAGGGSSGPGAAVPLTIPTPGVTPTATSPGVNPGTGSGVPAVVAVGRSVQQTSLQQLFNTPSNGNSGSNSGGSGSPDMQALGGIIPLPGPTGGDQQPTVQSSTSPTNGSKTTPPITTSPIIGPRPGSSPTGGALKGILGGLGGVLGLSPSPTASPVTPPTSTVTPPPTSTTTN